MEEKFLLVGAIVALYHVLLVVNVWRLGSVRAKEGQVVLAQRGSSIPELSSGDLPRQEGPKCWQRLPYTGQTPREGSSSGIMAHSIASGMATYL